MNECECLVEDGSGFLAGYMPSLIGDWLYMDALWWTVVGFAGAAIFGSRFVFQWLHSEKQKKLIVPWYFWHLSFWGSLLNFFYSMHLDKAPLIVGTIFLPVLYGRNLMLLNRSNPASDQELSGSG